jgi:hypothetical protein
MNCEVSDRKRQDKGGRGGEEVGVKKVEEEASDKHHSSAIISLISTDIARSTRLGRAYVAVCVIACVSVLGLLLVRIFFLK